MAHKHYKMQFAVILFTLSLWLVLSATISLVFAHPAQPAAVVSSIWPAANASIAGTQTFKGKIDGFKKAPYTMYWMVDDGPLHVMESDEQDKSIKTAQVDVSNWNWRSTGSYRITYTAKTLSGEQLGKTSFLVAINSQSAESVRQAAEVASDAQNAADSSQKPTATAQGTSPDTAIPVAPAKPIALRPFADKRFYVNPDTNVRRQANAWRAPRPADAAQLDKIANQPQAQWFGGWNSNLTGDVSSYVGAAAAQSAVPLLVAYNIPQRDCGGYSSGGTTSANYVNWIRAMAAGIGQRRAIVILEPDAISSIDDCLSTTEASNRLSLLSQAVTILKSNALTYVYIDAGNAHWRPVGVTANRLKSANIAAADGFSLNVSNFYSTADNAEFGKAVSDLVGQKHFVIDTSRNGSGSAGGAFWCNPSGRSLGAVPTGVTDNVLIDALLWIKVPGDSDGSCNGGPTAGAWWPEYALGLAQRASY